MNKIFCQKCRFLLTRNIHMEMEYECHHPNNRKQKDIWLRKTVSYKKEPQKINKNNNCVWFKKREDKEALNSSVKPPMPPTTEDCIESNIKVPNKNIISLEPDIVTKAEKVKNDE